MEMFVKENQEGERAGGGAGWMSENGVELKNRKWIETKRSETTKGEGEEPRRARTNEHEHKSV